MKKVNALSAEQVKRRTAVRLVRMNKGRAKDCHLCGNDLDRHPSSKYCMRCYKAINAEYRRILKAARTLAIMNVRNAILQEGV